MEIIGGILWMIFLSYAGRDGKGIWNFCSELLELKDAIENVWENVTEILERTQFFGCMQANGNCQTPRKSSVLQYHSRKRPSREVDLQRPRSTTPSPIRLLFLAHALPRRRPSHIFTGQRLAVSACCQHHWAHPCRIQPLLFTYHRQVQ